ncbi:ABC transporter ATP-binding protein [Lysobacteraceae bacterium NML91-0213]|nr:ABC transporter ATP-binding protein [Xanthomonadaceae bacterium NML91-0213]
MPNAAVIQLTDVGKVFSTDEIETHALAGINLRVDGGEYVAIRGPSGCGKSTLLSILGLLDTPSSGSYVLKGEKIEAIGHRERSRVRNREIGFIFQAFNLIGDLSVRKNIALPLTYRRELTKADIAERVDEALERVGMAHRANHLPSQLSGGQQQRIAVARALAGKPSVLLADEPTGNLDSANGELVMDLLGQLHEDGSTLCVVTHDPRHAERAQRTIEILDGRLVASPVSLSGGCRNAVPVTA